MKEIAVGADEAGAPLKERLADYMRQHGYTVKDYGNGSEQDYPDVAAEVAEAVARGEHPPGPPLPVAGLGVGFPAKKISPRRARIGSPGSPPAPTFVTIAAA